MSFEYDKSSNYPRIEHDTFPLALGMDISVFCWKHATLEYCTWLCVPAALRPRLESIFVVQNLR